jgi:biopolymer transport protein ExbD
MQLGRAAKLAGSGENAVRSEINVTPLVDVCLVLLIIFMVVTPLLMEGKPVQLPQTDQPEKMPEGAKQVDVAIMVDGSVHVGDDWVPDLDQLKTRLIDIHTATPDKDVVIKADRRIKYRDVRDVMRVINEAGFTGVGLATEKIENQSSG